MKKRMYRFTMSKETRLKRRKSLNLWYKLKRVQRENNQDPNIPKLLEQYRKAQKVFNSSKKKDKRRYFRNLITLKIQNKVYPWEIVKLLRPKLHVPDNQTTVINNKTGTGLANYMADYLYKRANLISDEEIKNNSEFIPLPKQFPKDISECSIDNEICVSTLLKNGKSFLSLACGPDTISHRHLVDLLPAIK